MQGVGPRCTEWKREDVYVGIELEDDRGDVAVFTDGLDGLAPRGCLGPDRVSPDGMMPQLPETEFPLDCPQSALVPVQVDRKLPRKCRSEPGI